MSLVVLAAGGTGGHLFPAEALARALRARGRRVALITDPRAADFGERIEGVKTHRLPLRPGRRGLVGRGLNAFGLVASATRALGLLRRLSPDVVVGFGGYPSVPTLLAALRFRRPTVLHEQNAALGKANRLFARRADRIATSFPHVRLLPKSLAGRVVTTGNPVRPEIVRVGEGGYAPPDATGPLRLLVLGGSQGARVFSTVVPAALALLPEALRQRLQVAQQARPEDVDAARGAYAAAGVAATVAPFFADVAERLAVAHLVICRSGASTVAELAVAGRPAVLVPYPHATDDHQSDNARALAEAGGGWLMPEAGLTPAALAAHLALLAAEPTRLAEAAQGARGMGRPDAAERLAGVVEELLAAPAGGAA